MMLSTRWMLAMALMLGLAASHWKAYHAGGVNGANAVQVKWDKQTAIDAAAYEAQRESNREALATADKKTIEARAEFERTIKGTQNELRKATANLASCTVDRDAVRLFNDAANAAKN